MSRVTPHRIERGEPGVTMAALAQRTGPLAVCRAALDVRGASQAQLWQAMRRVERVLASPGAR